MNESNFHISYTSLVPKLAERMRVYRERLGFSQEKVAHGAWVSVFTYVKYERGESNPGTPMNPQLHTLIGLADVFGVNVLELLDVDDDHADVYEHIYSSVSGRDANGESSAKGANNAKRTNSIRDINDSNSANGTNSTNADNDRTTTSRSVASSTPVNCKPEAFSKRLGERLQHLRWECDLSKEEVAERAGITLHSYHFLEKGESNPGTPANPRLKTLMGIADALDVDLIELLNINWPPSPEGQPTKVDPDPAGEEQWLSLV